jgi:hypothetical protein
MAGGSAGLRRGGRSGGQGNSTMSGAAVQRRPSRPVRLTLASTLGRNIDGAWWPRTGPMARELPELIAVLGSRLGEIIDIKVNWSSSQGPVKLDWYGWEGKHQPVMTISGRNGRANLLIVPHRTSTALAVMVLRRAADLPIDPAHRDTQAFQTADWIVRAARTESAVGCAAPDETRQPVSPSADIATPDIPQPNH